MSQKVVAEMTANVWKLLVKVGDEVTEGDELAILESMKMEIPVESDYSGKVTEVTIEEGGPVNEGDIMVVIA
ncbi:biotin/lipoyl-binding carrier protein [Brevibacterium jeotgali]|uniref:Acetyl-CoA carboxylase biotin carboxyl carrier protein n=1 Tax=Brevibacterium jeotgali TaxID=1262550 RepID=A0A2H1L8U2_9MICO|nr:biotin/lipoyl-binding carrier protein [Brevibacterium jeotgali]TWC03217.1 acetyl-CoA carboxylase biotin carboxyl carrier protein [Brevibacterium jeotgali]TWC03235.1 acetyl-CoA carboxylase biotin carboxyl carrier protein [Brevibacterium jeotgali]SMY13311.1 acetyl-CoA carboxylase biotin carboxyl carrier protein [Brevibacterium jeotgali]